MQTLHVIMNQRDIDPALLSGKVVVVFDVLLATTTISLALHQGAAGVTTVPEVEMARRAAQRFNRESVVLAGEKDARVPDGFESFQPSVLSNLDWRNRHLVLVSTNGTVALHNSRSADHVYACALTNLQAICNTRIARHPGNTILLVCAASKHRFNIEDFIGSGMLIDRLLQAAPERFHLTDAAQAAWSLSRTRSPVDVLTGSRVGRLLISLNMEQDVHLACQVDAMPVTPKLYGDVILESSGSDSSADC